MGVKEGWKGRFFEDFGVRDVYEHPLGRTVTQTDNAWFTLLTQNTAPIHFDHHYASRTEFAKPLVNSVSTVALVTGQSFTDVSQNVVANLAWDGIRLPSRGRHRLREDDRLQPEGRGRDHVQPNRHGLQEGTRSKGRPNLSRAGGQGA